MHLRIKRPLMHHHWRLSLDYVCNHAFVLFVLYWTLILYKVGINLIRSLNIPTRWLKLFPLRSLIVLMNLFFSVVLHLCGLHCLLSGYVCVCLYFNDTWVIILKPNIILILLKNQLFIPKTAHISMVRNAVLKRILILCVSFRSYFGCLFVFLMYVIIYWFIYT